MANRSESITIHDYGGDLKVNVTERFSKKGKGGKHTVDIRATPLVHTFDDRALAAEGAAALQKALQEDIRNQPVAAQATLDKRTYHARRWRGLVDERVGSNDRWLKRMYSGGRIGETPPRSGHESVRKWTGSGRLHQSLVGRWVPRAKAFIFNVAANRLRTRELATKFAEDMPTLENLAAFVNGAEMRRALEKSMDTLIAKAGKISDAQRVALRQRQLAVAKGLIDLAKVVGGA